MYVQYSDGVIPRVRVGVNRTWMEWTSLISLPLYAFNEPALGPAYHMSVHLDVLQKQGVPEIGLSHRTVFVCMMWYRSFSSCSFRYPSKNERT